MPDRAVRRRVLSQNFLVDRRAIDALVDGSRAGDGDLVVDIGAGNGLITEALARRGARVLAIERDPALAARLRARFGAWPAVTVAEADVLTAPLPAEPFRVVANIPFGITTKILRRLLDSDALARADLIVQAEVARKRGTRGRGTLLNACWEPWFEFGTGARIPATAFRPVPRVDTAVLIVTRRSSPLVDPASRRDYTDFVTAAFEGARPTVASALARTIPRARFAGLARELGFAPGALPSQLGADQWAGPVAVRRAAAVPVAGRLRHARRAAGLGGVGDGRVTGQLPDHADHLRRVERLGEVGVHADLLTARLVVLLGAGGDEHDLDRTGIGVAPEQARGHPAIQPGHHDVEGDHVGIDRGHLVQAVLAVHRGRDVEPFQGQVDGYELTNHLIVVHHEHASQSLRHGREVSVFPALPATARAGNADVLLRDNRPGTADDATRRGRTSRRGPWGSLAARRGSRTPADRPIWPPRLVTLRSPEPP